MQFTHTMCKFLKKTNLLVVPSDRFSKPFFVVFLLLLLYVSFMERGEESERDVSHSREHLFSLYAARIRMFRSNNCELNEFPHRIDSNDCSIRNATG